ncbi:MAG: DUF1501 domain-containing protein, partial [Pirellulales bacterium]
MNLHLEHLKQVTRRQFLQSCQVGLGGIALNSLLQAEAGAGPSSGVAQGPLAPKPSHFPGKAKSVIYLHMAGSPPHLDLFDNKPELLKRDDEDCPDAFL